MEVFALKRFIKQGLSLLLVLMMVLGVFSGITVEISAAGTVTYRYGTGSYSNVVYNWGTRGDEATFLSPMAISYYEDANTSYTILSGYAGSSSQSGAGSSALYSKLQSLMSNGATTNSYDANKSLAKFTDCQQNGNWNSGKISSFYSGTGIGPGWDSDEWNREHSWPNSKGGSACENIFMIRPTAISENSSRGNTAYGSGSGYYDPNSEGAPSNLRGDVARLVLGVWVRYGSNSTIKGNMWGTSGVMQSKEVLLAWIEEDPVDTWELGRNDSVESILGFRNVFVDYPELAFDLFEEPVPADMLTPSGEGATSSYTITATSNNTSYGTVSVSGKTITATPKTGYYASGYTVVSGSATVSQSGNTFTVTASSDCSIRINFAAKTTVTVSFSGANVTPQTGYAGESMTLPTATAPDGYNFVGWTKSPLTADTTTKPTTYTGSFTPTANTTLYALYSYTDGEGSGSSTGEYTLVTSVSQLQAGAKVLIASNEKGYVNGDLSGTYMSNVSATFSSDNSTISTVPSGSLPLTLGGSAGAWTFSNDSGSLLGATAAKSLSWGNGTTTWSITVTSDGATIQNGTSSYGRFLYNVTSPRFTTYTSNTSTTMLLPQLYIQESSGTVYYTSSLCEHTNTTNIGATAATCTEVGYTAGVYCNSCNTFISGHEEVAALGHQYDDGTYIDEPTCDMEGEIEYTCIRCDYLYTELLEPLGHNYVLSGNVYTCTNCSDSYTIPVISFSVPTGVSAVDDVLCDTNGAVMPAAGAPDGYTFLGWIASELDVTADKPGNIYKAGDRCTVSANTTYYALYTYTENDGGGDSAYELKDISAIGPNDTFVITTTHATNGTYALPNNETSKPTAVNVAVSNNKLSAEPAENLLWNLGGDSSGYIFYPDGITDSWLYCGNSNTGVTVGTNSSNTFVIDSSSGYLKHLGTGRYLGVYNKQDWRCYTSSTTNIGGQELQFYVKTAQGTAYYTTLPSAAEEQPDIIDCWNVELADNVGLNFVLNVSDEDAADAEALVMFGDALLEYVIADLDKNENGQFVLHVEVAACQMREEILLSVTVNDTTVENTYSVRQYAEYVLKDENGEFDDATKDMVMAMLHYGAAAQLYFDYDVDNLANDGYADNTNHSINSVELTAIQNPLDGIVYYGATLLYKERVATRLYFLLGEGADISSYAFEIGGSAQNPVYSEQYGMYYIKSAGILPYLLDQNISVTINDTMTVQYAPLCYIFRQYNNTADNDLKNLMQQLYDYYVAADYLVANGADDFETDNDVLE